MDLVEFLLARFAEREAVARKAKPGPWTYDGDIYAGHPTDQVVDWVYDESAEHIALNDPAYVLADLEAKRRIVEDHGDQHDCTSLSAGDWPYVGCTTLRLLALPYAGHPDFQPEWAPEITSVR